MSNHPARSGAVLSEPDGGPGELRTHDLCLRRGRIRAPRPPGKGGNTSIWQGQLSSLSRPSCLAVWDICEIDTVAKCARLPVRKPRTGKYCRRAWWRDPGYRRSARGAGAWIPIELVYFLKSVPLFISGRHCQKAPTWHPVALHRRWSPDLWIEWQAG